jgi:hypothetical protein
MEEATGGRGAAVLRQRLRRAREAADMGGGRRLRVGQLGQFRRVG